MRPFLRRVVGSQEAGLVSVVILLTLALSLLAGSHVDRRTGEVVNNFLNSRQSVQSFTALARRGTSSLTGLRQNSRTR
jgi:ribose transport system permease protein